MPSEKKGRGVVRTDAKYVANSPFFYTDVMFRNKREIRDLIAALTALLNSRSKYAHFHLQDFKLHKNGPFSSAEIFFHRANTAGKPNKIWVGNRRAAVRKAELMLSEWIGKPVGKAESKRRRSRSA